jgi:hypothetical protein
LTFPTRALCLWFELRLVATALMVLFIGIGRRGVAEPAMAKAYS